MRGMPSRRPASSARLHYETVLVWARDRRNVLPFYAYDHGVGLIPAEMSVGEDEDTSVGRRASREGEPRRYTTAGLMTLLASTPVPRLPRTRFSLDQWIDASTQQVDARRFVEYYRRVEACHRRCCASVIVAAKPCVDGRRPHGGARGRVGGQTSTSKGRDSMPDAICLC